MVLNIKSWFFALFLLFESRFWSKSRHFCLFFVQNCSFLMVFDMKSWFFASILLFWGSFLSFLLVFCLFLMHFCLFFVQNCSFLVVFDMKSWFFARFWSFKGFLRCFLLIFDAFLAYFCHFLTQKASKLTLFCHFFVVFHHFCCFAAKKWKMGASAQNDPFGSKFTQNRIKRVWRLVTCGGWPPSHVHNPQPTGN